MGVNIENGTQLVGGQIVMWELTQASSYDGVRAALEAGGLIGLMPGRRTAESALTGAAAALFEPLEKKHKVLVRAVKASASETDGIKKWAIYDENPAIKGEDRFTPINVVWIAGGTVDEDGNRIDSPDSPLRIEFERYVDYDFRSTMVDTWLAMRATLSRATVGTILADCITALRGIPLRDRGGTYWLPKSQVDRWSVVARNVENAGRKDEEGKQSKVYGINIVADDSMIECVGDQMVRELSARLSEMQDAMVTDQGMVQLKPQTVQARRKRLEEYRRQTENFTSAFGRKLDELSVQFTTCEALLATYMIAEGAAMDAAAELEQAAA